MIGGQVFRGQVEVALARGHASNAFEVNAHVGVLREGGETRFGDFRGRDGVVRSTCGAMHRVLEEYVRRPDLTPEVSREIDGGLALDFVATLAWRMRPRFDDIRADASPVSRAALVNLDVQVEALVGYVRRLAPVFGSGPVAVAATVSWNVSDGDPLLSLARLILLRPPAFSPEVMAV